jgi:dihydrofolate reductase/ribosomal protein S18 acetylase RimI-like enzyme
MRKIIYYVAASLDGFISGLNGDISAFAITGNGVDKYLSDLKNFDTVIMGRKTYEFGYKYGLVPGQPAYPHMAHYIFSDSLQFENTHPNVHIVKLRLAEIETIQKQAGTDIYLCGGGQFAGWLLRNQKIDILKLKLNPILLGNGEKIFDNADAACRLNLLDTEKYEQGLQIITYQVLYNKGKADSFQIVPYNDSYRQQLLSVWEQSVAATHYFLTPEDFEEIKEIVGTIDFNAFPVFCLLHNDNSVIGFIGVADKKVEMLFVLPNFIRKGMGRRLLNFAFQELNANEVDVNEQNQDAVNFYGKLGFEVYERTEKDGQGKDYPLLKMRLKKT